MSYDDYLKDIETLLFDPSDEDKLMHVAHALGWNFPDKRQAIWACLELAVIVASKLGLDELGFMALCKQAYDKCGDDK
jgi:hypothetical protein